jgi:hypothetical protein
LQVFGTIPEGPAAAVHNRRLVFLTPKEINKYKMRCSVTNDKASYSSQADIGHHDIIEIKRIDGQHRVPNYHDAFKYYTTLRRQCLVGRGRGISTRRVGHKTIDV